MKLFCSTGALIGLANGRNYRLLEEIVPHIDCEGFEFMMYSTWYEEKEEIVKVLQGLPVSFPVTHVEKRIGEKIASRGDGDWEEAFEKFHANCRIAKAIGSKLLVMHLWSGTISDSRMENNLEAYPLLKSIAGEYGLRLTVENVVCNQRSPMVHLKELQEKDQEVLFTFDTKMADFHKELDLVYEKEWEWLFSEKHVAHLHINDHQGAYMDWSNLRALPIGEGTIDFQRFFDFIRTWDYAGNITYEASGLMPSGEVDYDKINESLRIIREYWNKASK